MKVPNGVKVFILVICSSLIQRWDVFQILESDKRITLGQNDTGFSCDGSANTFRVMFKEPIEILPSVSYTACATLKVSPNSPRWPWKTQSRRFITLNVSFLYLSGSRLTLRHQRFEESDPGVDNRDQDNVFLLQLAWKQQRYIGGGRADPWDHLLHLGRQDVRRLPKPGRPQTTGRTGLSAPGSPGRMKCVCTFTGECWSSVVNNLNTHVCWC